MNILRDHNKTYSIIHIEDEEDIHCSVQMDTAFKDNLVCTFVGKSIRHLEPVENRYFHISFTAHKAIIKPKYNFTYHAFSSTFIEDTTLSQYKAFPAKHWIVTGFKGKSDLYSNKEHLGLEFPITLTKMSLPSIGELNYDLKPIIKKRNANSVVRIKQAYKDKYYDKVLKEADLLLTGADSIFSSEAKLYKIRALDKILNNKKSIGADDGLDPEEIIRLSKEWISENPSNDDLPEMYMYIAKTYLNIGRASQAQKYLDILEHEYPKNPFHLIAQLTAAEKTYLKNKNDGIKSYKDILYKTDDFDIASQAAMKLSEAYLEKDKVKKAKAFIEKVLTSNEKFIKVHAHEACSLAKKFAENNDTNTSLSLANIIQESEINKDELKKDIAYWHEKEGHIYKAISQYKKYLKDEKSGKYRGFVSEHLDKIMLLSDENNDTKKLKHLNTIMMKYPEDAIYAKALIEKAKIYLKEKSYDKILQMKEDLEKHGGHDLLKEVAKKQLAQAYHDSHCQEAFKIEKDYNITAAGANLEKAFICSKEAGLYERAQSIAKQKIHSKKLDEQLRWSYELVQIYKHLGKHKSLLLLADDVDTLQKVLKTTQYDDIIYDKIIAYYHLGGYDDLMIAEVKRMEKTFPDKVKNLDIFEKVLSYAKKRRDNSLIINYAKKMVDLQQKHHIDTYTPKLQLDYIQALRAKERYKEALDEDIKLLYKKLNDTQRAHVLYIAGDLSEKFKKSKEAKEFYTKCGEIVENSAWVELCSENLKLLDD